MGIFWLPYQSRLPDVIARCIIYLFTKDLLYFRPILVSCKSGSQGAKEQVSDDERELQAMKWGLVPSWHRGDPSSFGYKMNNARIESITEKKSFKGALEKGRRCVVLAEG